jgi:alkaline phosphatase D
MIRESVFGLWAVVFPSVLFGQPELSHGPILGGVTETSASIWFRTTIPATIEVELNGTQSISTSETNDLMGIARFSNLSPDTVYKYRLRQAGKELFTGECQTPGPSSQLKPLRVVFGSCYKPQIDLTGGKTVFQQMAGRNADLVMFIGDFPYTENGALAELRDAHKAIRSMPGFAELTGSRSTYAIWDDHDFGPNDCDGTHKFAAEALAGFQEHWPNPAYGLPNAPGIFFSFRWGHTEFFMTDDRYAHRQKLLNPSLLGKTQFDRLCDGLKKSTARYKVIACGVTLTSNKKDSWAGPRHRPEHDRLFQFLADNKISGVIFLSGDIHRSEVRRIPLPNGRHLYEFTSSPLAQKNHVPKPDLDDTSLLFRAAETNLFGELEFRPGTDTATAVICRIFSARTGLLHEHKLSPADLHIP